MGREKTVGHVTNAFALVISMGTIMLVVALAGLLGACCARYACRESFSHESALRAHLIALKHGIGPLSVSKTAGMCAAGNF